MLLPLELADIVIDRVRPDRLAVAADWDDDHVDVDESAILTRAPGDAMSRSFGHRLVHDRSALPSERLGPEYELLDRPAERLGLRVPEERLGGWVPRRHVLIEVESHDGHRADLEQGLEVLLLTA